MPVSGRPIKAALLKTTQGSSGPDVKPFQNTRNAAGTGSLSLASPAGPAFRVAISHTITRIAAARKMERAMTSVPHRRSGSCDSLETAATTVAEADFGWVLFRG